MKRSIHSILKSIDELKVKDDVINGLRSNDHPVIRQLFYYVYSPDIKFLLPEGAPPYKPCDFLDQEGRLYVEARKMYLFIEGGNPNLSRVKREVLFIQLIESISKDDAELLIHVKDKKLPFKYINEKVIREAFPDLLPSNSPQEENDE